MNTELPKDTPPLRLGISGLGGWLVLVQIGLYASLLLLALQLFNDSIPALQSEEWELLTTKGTEWYDPLWQPLLAFEITANVLMLLMCAYCLYNLYRKKTILPKLMIIFYSVNLAVGIIDYALLNQIELAKELDLIGQDAVTDNVRAAITCAIWIPYFLKSERVQNTFIR